MRHEGRQQVQGSLLGLRVEGRKHCRLAWPPRYRYELRAERPSQCSRWRPAQLLVQTAFRCLTHLPHVILQLL